MKINFGGVTENVVTRDEFPLSKARKVLKNEIVAVLGYGVQGPGQALNMRDNGINVIIGQRKKSKSWQKAKEDGWVPGKTLYFSHGFSITYKKITKVIPPKDIDVVLVAPKGSGLTVRRNYQEGSGINSSYAIFQDATGNAKEKCLALGIAVGSGYLFPTTFQKEVFSDLTGERGILIGALEGVFEAQY